MSPSRGVAIAASISRRTTPIPSSRTATTKARWSIWICGAQRTRSPSPSVRCDPRAMLRSRGRPHTGRRRRASRSRSIPWRRGAGQLRLSPIRHARNPDGLTSGVNTGFARSNDAASRSRISHGRMSHGRISHGPKSDVPISGVTISRVLTSRDRWHGRKSPGPRSRARRLRDRKSHVLRLRGQNRRALTRRGSNNVRNGRRTRRPICPSS